MSRIKEQAKAFDKRINTQMESELQKRIVRSQKYLDSLPRWMRANMYFAGGQRNGGFIDGGDGDGSSVDA